MSFLIPLPWDRPPLSLNDRGVTPWVKAKATREAREQAGVAILLSGPPAVVGATITLHYRVADRRRRDVDNLAPVLKVVQDALVDVGVIPDDSWVHVPASGSRIHPPNVDGPAMWLELDPTEEGVI